MKIITKKIIKATYLPRTIFYWTTITSYLYWSINFNKKQDYDHNGNFILIQLCHVYQVSADFVYNLSYIRNYYRQSHVEMMALGLKFELEI